MLPMVTAIGILGKDAIYNKVSDKGGYVKFQLLCKKDDPRTGDPNPYNSYLVSYWIKEGSKLPQFLIKGKEVFISGDWTVDKVGENYINTIHAIRLKFVPLSGKGSE